MTYANEVRTRFKEEDPNATMAQIVSYTHALALLPSFSILATGPSLGFG